MRADPIAQLDADVVVVGGGAAGVAANGSARVMGTCLAMGQGAGIAAATAVEGRLRSVVVDDLRATITATGGVVEGPP